jgi:hypothetical protein
MTSDLLVGASRRESVRAAPRPDVSPTIAGADGACKPSAARRAIFPRPLRWQGAASPARAVRRKWACRPPRPPPEHGAKRDTEKAARSFGGCRSTRDTSAPRRNNARPSRRQASPWNLSSGGETQARLYWSAGGANIVSDIPSEAELTPHRWGTWVFQRAGNAEGPPRGDRGQSQWAPDGELVQAAACCAYLAGCGCFSDGLAASAP